MDHCYLIGPDEQFLVNENGRANFVAMALRYAAIVITPGRLEELARISGIHAVILNGVKAWTERSAVAVEYGPHSRRFEHTE